MLVGVSVMSAGVVLCCDGCAVGGVGGAVGWWLAVTCAGVGGWVRVGVIERACEWARVFSSLSAVLAVIK